MLRIALVLALVGVALAFNAPNTIDSICRRYPDNPSCSCVLKSESAESPDIFLGCACGNPQSFIDSLFVIPEISTAMQPQPFLISLQKYCGPTSPKVLKAAGDTAKPIQLNVAAAVNLLSNSGACARPRIAPLCRPSVEGTIVDLLQFHKYVCVTDPLQRSANRDFMITTVGQLAKATLDVAYLRSSLDLLCGSRQ